MTFAGYVHVGPGPIGAPYVPPTPYGVRRHECAMAGCRESVWSHYSPDLTKRQYWLVCDWHWRRLPDGYTISPMRDPRLEENK